MRTILIERKGQQHHGGETVYLGLIFGLALVLFSWPVARQAQASCGAVSCFVVIGSRQQVPSEAHGQCDL
jgi:uncharacterized membrane protein